ncbi:hypothetical protein ACQP1O_22440 [Nocardia sp. CA-151230]|uniref:ATP dependent DNA ligase n=1 Tax=Nocardia sp. CA-151230 TaxID=3239982 RepID=UPI003D8B9E37
MVAGFLGTGPAADSFSALAVGAHDETGAFRFVGTVGSGRNEPARRLLRAAMDRLRRDEMALAPPLPDLLRHAQAVEPVLVATVAYREITADGVLRHPSLLGILTDRAATDIKLPKTGR